MAEPAAAASVAGGLDSWGEGCGRALNLVGWEFEDWIF